MTRGNFAIGYLETSVHKHPRELFHEYDMVIMGDNGIGSVHPISKADGMRLAKKINAFKRVLHAEMMEAAKRLRNYDHRNLQRKT